MDEQLDKVIADNGFFDAANPGAAGVVIEAASAVVPMSFVGRVATLAGEINSRRDQKVDEGVDYNGKRYDSNEQSKQRVLGTLVVMQGKPASTPVQWITQDNAQVNLTHSDMQALAAVIAQNESQWVFWARNLKDKLTAVANGDEAGLATILAAVYA